MLTDNLQKLFREYLIKDSFLFYSIHLHFKKPISIFNPRNLHFFLSLKYFNTPVSVSYVSFLLQLFLEKNDCVRESRESTELKMTGNVIAYEMNLSCRHPSLRFILGMASIHKIQVENSLRDEETHVVVCIRMWGYYERDTSLYMYIKCV